METFSWLEGKTILITGVAGFLGSHLAERALRSGAKVIGVDNFLTGSKVNLQHIGDITFIEADASSNPSEYLDSLGTEAHIDAVLHFASPASPPRYQAHPIETYLVNSYGTHQLLEYLRAHYPAARFLFASTSEVYGDPAVHPQPESYWGNVNPNGVRACYDEAKRLGETICGVHQRDFGQDVRIVRIFNTYGPRMAADDGRVIPSFITSALTETELPIHGTGEFTRSYCYVDDLVTGILRFISADSLSAETINLGNPEEFSVVETARIIWETIHGEETTPKMSYIAAVSDDPTRRRPDISKAKELLSWEPAVPFSQGLQQTIEYFRALQK